MGKTQEKIKRTILSRIRKNEAIKDPSHVSVEIKSTGFLFWKKNEIHVLGRVDLAVEKEEIDKIIESEAHGMIIKNTLRLKKG